MTDQRKRSISCIVVDDEPLALQQMKGFVKGVSSLHLQDSFDNATDALFFLKNHVVDLIFLDVEMDGLSGIQLIEVLEHKPLIILTTAYESYALKGYELDVFDYLLKPVSYQRFLKSVSRAHDRLTEIENKNQLKAERDFIFVKTEHQLQKVSFNEILYIEGLSNYLILHLTNEKVYVLMSFGEMEKLLPPDRFFRIHKSFIISLDKVNRISKTHLKINKTEVPVGQTYKKKFFKELEERNLI